MGGDIKIVKKEGPGTLVRFFLLFGQPTDSEPETPRLSVPAELSNAKVRALKPVNEQVSHFCSTDYKFMQNNLMHQ